MANLGAIGVQGAAISCRGGGWPSGYWSRTIRWTAFSERLRVSVIEATYWSQPGGKRSAATYAIALLQSHYWPPVGLLSIALQKIAGLNPAGQIPPPAKESNKLFKMTGFVILNYLAIGISQGSRAYGSLLPSNYWGAIKGINIKSHYHVDGVSSLFWAQSGGSGNPSRYRVDRLSSLFWMQSGANYLKSEYKISTSNHWGVDAKSIYRGSASVPTPTWARVTGQAKQGSRFSIAPSPAVAALERRSGVKGRFIAVSHIYRQASVYSAIKETTNYDYGLQSILAQSTIRSVGVSALVSESSTKSTGIVSPASEGVPATAGIITVVLGSLYSPFSVSIASLTKDMGGDGVRSIIAESVSTVASVFTRVNDTAAKIVGITSRIEDIVHGRYCVGITSRVAEIHDPVINQVTVVSNPDQIDAPPTVSQSTIISTDVLNYKHIDVTTTIIAASGKSFSPLAIESMNADESTWIWSCTIMFGSADQYAAFSKGDLITVNIGSLSWKMIVDSKATSFAGRGFEWSINCMSPICLCGDPWATPLTHYWTGQVLASELAAMVFAPLLAHGFAYSWDIVDWAIPGKSIRAHLIDPLRLLTSIIREVGAVGKSDPNGSVHVVYKRPVDTPYQGGFPILWTPSSLTRVSAPPVHKRTFNSIIVSNSSLPIDPTASRQIDNVPGAPLKKVVRVFPVPWNDISLDATAPGSVNPGPRSDATETVQETVPIIGGVGRLSRPASAVSVLSWEGPNLGAISVQDGTDEIGTETFGNSLVTVKYTTHFWEWTVTAATLGPWQLSQTINTPLGQISDVFQIDFGTKYSFTVEYDVIQNEAVTEFTTTDKVGLLVHTPPNFTNPIIQCNIGTVTGGQRRTFKKFEMLPFSKPNDVMPGATFTSTMTIENQYANRGEPYISRITSWRWLDNNLGSFTLLDDRKTIKLDAMPTQSGTLYIEYEYEPQAFLWTPPAGLKPEDNYDVEISVWV